MRYYSLNDLKPGMVLGRSIFGYGGKLMLAKGKPLDQGFIHRIGQLGYAGTYIDEPGFEAIDPPEIIDPALRASANDVLLECFDTLNNLSPIVEKLEIQTGEKLTPHPEIERAVDLNKIKDKVNRIVDELLEEYTTELPCLLLKAQNSYQIEHAMDTMVVALLIGINFRFIHRELKQLGLAAMLHDVGKSLLIQKGEQNVGPNHPRYKEHPALGAMIVQSFNNNHYTECAAIHQHHESQNGKGFPTGLIGYNKPPTQNRSSQSSTIYRLAEIISVADAYDVLTSGAYQSPLSPEQAILRIVKRSFYEFNSHVVRTLTRVVQIYPVGSQVKLLKCTDVKLQGSRGVISKSNPDNPHRVDLILTHDSTGRSIPLTAVSLQDDPDSRLELLL